MKLKLTILISIIIIFNSHSQVTYPNTQMESIKDVYFGTEVDDPYRWLEDDKSPKVKDWIKEQNKLTFSYLEQIPERELLKNRLEKLWNYEKIGTPFKEGDYTYYYKNDGLQNQYVLYRKNEEKEEVFIDPNKFSDDGTISLAGTYFSEDGSLLAYSISEGGSDWRKVIVMDTETKTVIGDTLLDIKFSGISWYKNEGFYYSSYKKPKKSVLSDKTDRHILYYHQLNSLQKNDKIIFGNEHKYRYVSGYVTKDQCYLVISASKETSGNNLFIKNIKKRKSKLIQITNNFESNSYIVHNIKSKLFISTNLNAPNKKIVVVDANKPKIKNWKDFIPETNSVLNISKGGGYFFAEYFIDANSKIFQYNFDGKLIREVSFSGKGNVSGFSGKENQKKYFIISVII